ncbi:MAG: hypothetical protein O3C40_25565 [Planctomycetota bacterium]|nr:hypothetical protein [Planctomycetota bacterium]
MKLHSIVLSIMLALAGMQRCCKGQDARGTDAPQPSEQTRSLEQVRAEALEHARAIRVALAADGSAVELIENPLLRFGEPTRGNEDGSLWAWGKRGRPLVMSEIYRGVGDKVQWVHAISLTSTPLVTADTDTGRWAPGKPQLELQEIVDAPPPSRRAAARLAQMKALALRLRAHQFWDPDNSRYELRLMVSPVHRYNDVNAGLLDGAVFLFAHGTNPEVLMFVEARVGSGGEAKWYRGFAPSGSAEMHVTLEGADVWKLPRAPGVVGQPSDPYWLFFTAAESGSAPKVETSNR